MGLGTSQPVFVEPVAYGFEDDYKNEKPVRIARTEIVSPRPACATCITRLEKTRLREANAQDTMRERRQTYQNTSREFADLERRVIRCTFELDTLVKRNTEITVTGEHAPVHLRRQLKNGHSEMNRLNRQVDFIADKLIKQNDFLKTHAKILANLHERTENAKTMVTDCAARRSRR